MCIYCQDYLYFTVTDEVTDENKLISNELGGEYHFEVSIDDCHKKISKKFPVYLGEKETLEAIGELLKSDSLNSIMDELIDDVEETRKTQYGSMFDNISIPKVTVSLR